MISGFRREVDVNCALLSYYAASSGNFLPTFRDNFSASLKMGPIGCPESSVRNYHYWLCNDLEKLSSCNRSYTCWTARPYENAGTKILRRRIIVS